MPMTLNIPADLARQARSHALDRGTSVSAEVTRWLNRWVAGNDPWPEDKPFDPGGWAGEIERLQAYLSRSVVLPPELHAQAQEVAAATGLSLDAAIARLAAHMVNRYSQAQQPEAAQEADTHETP